MAKLLSNGNIGIFTSISDKNNGILASVSIEITPDDSGYELHIPFLDSEIDIELAKKLRQNHLEKLK